MRTIKITLAFLSFFTISVLSAQNWETPPEGKSLVYFVRSNGAGALINFKYFDGDKYLGKFNGVNYIMVECDPGTHNFWGASENRDYIDAELLPNKTYVVEVVPRMGAIKATVKMFPVDPTDAKRLKRVNRVISKKEPKQLDASAIFDEEKELDFFIKNGMEKYEKIKRSGNNILKIESNMFHN